MAILERIHLEILRAVDQHGSLTAAAERLHLTQSALSHSIRKLEELLGVSVWHRDGRALRPTPAGTYLLGVAQRLVPQLEQAEGRLRQFAEGARGTLRVGTECDPCYQWVLKVAPAYLAAWPAVDLDVRQKFQFGGLGALFAHEIDLLVTPDPLHKPGLSFEAIFDYEQVLVVGAEHRLRHADHAAPEDLTGETLITYPVTTDRLDIFSRFLTPAGVAPRQHKHIETTSIILEMVASGRGVAALPRWLVEEQAGKPTVYPVRLGVSGVHKQVFLGIREADGELDYLRGFMDLARSHSSGSGG